MENFKFLDKVKLKDSDVEYCLLGFNDAYFCLIKWNEIGGVNIDRWTGKPSELLEKVKVNQKLNDKDIVNKIIPKTIEHLGVSRYNFNSKKKDRGYAEARQIAMYLSCKLTSESMTLIGKLIGNRTHATVIHAKKNVADLMDTQPEFRKKVLKIESEIIKI